MENKDLNSKIVIIGAGASGLSAAHFLKKSGYKNVLVLEKLGRVGGLCRTITEDYMSFDLGANYITLAYKETRKLANEIGAKQYAERPFTAVQIPEDETKPIKIMPFRTAVLENASVFKMIISFIKFVWLRFKLRKILNPPGMSGVKDHHELCVSFLSWLKRHNIECLEPVFVLPITHMGYGYMDEIPAPYALKFMTLKTAIPMVLKEVPLVNIFFPWPKRFVLGYQRLWEAISWKLDVRLNVKVSKIQRIDGKVRVSFSHQEQIFNETNEHFDTLEFDHLILACPLTLDVLDKFIDVSDQEKKLFSKIITNHYCLTSFKVKFPEIKHEDLIFATVPLTPIGTPWAIIKQREESDLVQFYSRVNPAWKEEEIREKTIKAVKTFIKRLNGTIDNEEWHTYDRWPYFQHVSADDIASGFYDELEAMQGVRNTYYVGGIMNFELVENIIAYSKELVKMKFPGRSSFSS